MEVLVESVMNWMEAAPMLDDVTMVVVRKV